MSLPLSSIAEVVGGALSGPGAVIPRGYSIDSRTLAAGDLFFAIVGPNTDGHRYLAGAIERGACGLVVSDVAAADQLRLQHPHVPSLLVPDTLRALQDLAAFARRSMAARIVGITGSGGKTTTKEMTRAVLEASFNVHASRGNLNNLFGCPLSILQMTPQHQVAVLEMGMSYHGELARLAEIADPDIGVLTNVSAAHLAHFTSIDDVASAKRELFDGMRADSIGIFNNDDEQCRRIIAAFKGYAVTFGIDRESDLTASDYRMNGLEGSSFEVLHTHNGGERRVGVTMRFVGIHNVYNALAAISVGYMLGIDLGAAAARLADIEPLGMRGRVRRLGRDVRVLDDSYNSNPAAMRHLLRVLSDAAAGPGGRKIVVFGDMLELGEQEVEAHREIGRAMAGTDAALLVGVGRLAHEALATAPDRPSRHFDDAASASAFVAQEARPGDLILVKGSRGVALESVVEALVERFGEE